MSQFSASHSFRLTFSFIIKVLMVNGNATAELMNEHPSLRDAIWRIVAASMLLRNSQWVKDATQASIAMGANAAPDAWVMPPDVSARDLALSIVRPHQSRGGRAKSGYLAILGSNSGTKSSGYFRAFNNTLLSDNFARI